VSGRKRVRLVTALLPAAIRLAVVLRLPAPRSRR
jgi:hypothetical protein